MLRAALGGEEDGLSGPRLGSWCLLAFVCSLTLSTLAVLFTSKAPSDLLAAFPSPSKGDAAIPSMGDAWGGDSDSVVFDVDGDRFTKSELFQRSVERGCLAPSDRLVLPPPKEEDLHVPQPTQKALRDPFWCSDHAGDGKFNTDGEWQFEHTEACGHHWFTEAEACAMLKGYRLIFVGDSTSRRLSATLSAFLGGLKTACLRKPMLPNDPITVPQTIPDVQRFTDFVKLCKIESRCNGTQLKYKVFTGTSESLPQVFGSIKAEVARNKNENLSTIVVINYGAWSLQGFRRFELPAGTLTALKIPDILPYLAPGAKTQKKALVVKNGFSSIESFHRKNIKAIHKFLDSLDPSKVLPVWRASAAVNGTGERFGPDLASLAESQLYTNRTYTANMSSPDYFPPEKLNVFTKNKRNFYTTNPNEQLGRLNREALAASLSTKHVINANVFNATYQVGQDGFEFPRADYSPRGGEIHLRDHGRRQIMQVFLNTIYSHIAARAAGTIPTRAARVDPVGDQELP